MSTNDLSQSASSVNEFIVEVENSNEDLNVLPQTVDVQGIQTSGGKDVLKKARKKISTVWEFFVEVGSTSKGVSTPMLQCNCCHTKFHKPKSGTTSQLLKHVKEFERIKAKKIQSTNQSDKRQKLLNFVPLEADSGIEIPLFHDPKNFDQIQIREIIAKMIIVHEYPFVKKKGTVKTVLPR